MVVDPQRDIDRVLSVLDRDALTVTHVVETHIHNDYVTGGLELARRLDAAYVVPAGYELAYEATQLGDGDSFRAGDHDLAGGPHPRPHPAARVLRRPRWPTETRRRCSRAAPCCTGRWAART